MAELSMVPAKSLCLQHGRGFFHFPANFLTLLGAGGGSFTKSEFLKHSVQSQIQFGL